MRLAVTIRDPMGSEFINLAMASARTGLKLDAALYRSAQKHASENGQSFAAYVTDLIALDLSRALGSEGDEIADIRRVRRISRNHQLPGIADLEEMEERERNELAHQIAAEPITPYKGSKKARVSTS